MQIKQLLSPEFDKWYQISLGTLFYRFVQRNIKIEDYIKKKNLPPPYTF